MICCAASLEEGILTDFVIGSDCRIGFDVLGTESSVFSWEWDCACGIVVESVVGVTGSVCEVGEEFGLEGGEEEA